MALNVSLSQGKELSHLSYTTSSHHFRTNSGIDMLTFRAWRQSVKLYEREIEIEIALKLKYILFHLISNHNSNSNLNYNLTSNWNQHEIKLKSVWNQTEIYIPISFSLASNFSLFGFVPLFAPQHSYSRCCPGLFYCFRVNC